jgi:hypothetical protein
MVDKPANIIVTGATALYPRLNQTYKFVKNGDRQERVACPPTDDGAEYTLNLVLTKAQAVPLYKAMKTAYTKGKKDNWPEFPSAEETFEVNDNGEYIARTKLKGAFNNEPTSIAQFDASNNELPKDFMLTTGSKINVLVTFVVYDPSRLDGSGVSLRLRQVQVIELAELKKRSAFDAVEGGFNSQSDGFATGFEAPADDAAKAPEGPGFDGNYEEDAPEGKKSKPADKAKPKADTKNVEDFNDIDDALDNLDFDDA